MKNAPKSGRTALRAAKCLLGLGLSGLGVISGLWLRENISPILAVGPFTAGLYVLMRLVADDLVPGASPMVTGYLKLTTALVFIGWAPLAFWSFWTGTPI